MTFDDLVVLLCGSMWLLHLLQLLRARRRVSRSALAIAGAGLAGTCLAGLGLAAYRGAVAAALLVLFLILPASLTRAAARALRFGHIVRARVFARLALALRPVAAQRMFRRAVDSAWRLAVGEAVDVEQAVRELGPLSELEQAVQQIALLSWTSDYPAMAQLLARPGVRDALARSGSPSLLISVVGETEDAAAVVREVQALLGSGALARRTVDARWALALGAAYLGAEALVDDQVDDLAGEVPPERIAFLRATSLQRAGRGVDARTLLEPVLARPNLLFSARRRLHRRLEQPLEPIALDEAGRRVLGDIARQLHVHRGLAVWGFRGRRPAPFTLALALSIAAAYAGQLGLPRADEAFLRWGLVAPFERAPDGYRLLSYAWLHLDLGHLAVNLIGLLLFGRYVERGFGRGAFVAIYLAGAVMGALAYLAFEPGLGVAIGASGAVLALFGATLARVAGDRVLRTTRAGRRELLLLGAVAALQLAVDAVWAESSGSAHAGGFVAGILLGGAISFWASSRN